MSNELSLYALKKIEVILKGDSLSYIEDVLKKAGVTGYTILRDVSGMGHGGFHGGRLLFNDRDSYAMLVTVAPENSVNKILTGLKPFLETHSGVVFVSDTQVLRQDYFSDKKETAGS